MIGFCMYNTYWCLSESTPAYASWTRNINEKDNLILSPLVERRCKSSMFQAQAEPLTNEFDENASMIVDGEPFLLFAFHCSKADQQSAATQKKKKWRFFLEEGNKPFIFSGENLCSHKSSCVQKPHSLWQKTPSDYKEFSITNRHLYVHIFLPATQVRCVQVWEMLQ